MSSRRRLSTTRVRTLFIKLLRRIGRKSTFGVLTFLLLSSWIVVSCGAKDDRVESNGKLVKIGNVVRRVSAQEQDVICQNNYCEPNYIYHISFGPKPVTSPTAAPQPSPTASPPVVGDVKDYSRAILNMEAAWNISQGSREIVVAVVDTGIDYKHEDLRSNIWANFSEANGKSGVDDDQNGYVDDIYGWNFAENKPNGLDDHRHGTHCAGIIGAEQNGTGSIGISPLIKLMPLKFLSADGSGDTDSAIKAIRYATQMGARVISNSWGGGGYSKLLEEAIQDAQAKGILVVAAAGNYSNDNDMSPLYPANYEGVIAVASTDENDDLSSFSDFGKKTVMIAAPGSRIYSTLLKNEYGNLSGTSMACPQVSGALALGLARFPDLNAQQLKEKLCNTAKPILLDSVKCGRMDVRKFLE